MNNFCKLYWKFRIFIQLKGKKFPLPDARPRCLIFLAADYGNLGDVAITFAQKKFLQKHFPGHDVIEIPAAQTLASIRSIKRQIKANDIITVVGGGNMGDMYGDIELLRLLVVKSFPNNRIILFPQTINYSTGANAEWLKRLSQKIYTRHTRLTMTAREEVSYNTMKQLYPRTDVRFTPDIVMGLNERSLSTNRKDIVTFCLRNDRERANNDTDIATIKNLCHEYGLKIEIHDTHIGGDRFTETEKYDALKKLWSQFGRSRLVVTDRLHGMIFAYITGTPALVLPNNNFKITACHHWLKKVCGIQIFSSKNAVCHDILSSKIEIDPLITEVLDTITHNVNNK